MNNYTYKLQYIYDETTITHEFPADIDEGRFLLYLRDFLCGCSWTDEQVKRMLNLEDEE